MKPIAGIEAPEISEAEIVHRWDVATGREDRAEKTLAESRLEKGRILVVARKMFPLSGRNARGWGELLKRLRVDDETARRYMALAGVVGLSPQSEEKPIPTYAEAGITAGPRSAPPKSLPVAEQSAPIRAPVGDDSGPLSVEPMPDDERAALVERLHREDEERRQAALAPLRMENRKTAVSRTVSRYERVIAELNETEDDLDLCTTSPSDRELIKVRALTMYWMTVRHVARLGIEPEAEPSTPSTKRQLSLVPGDIR